MRLSRPLVALHVAPALRRAPSQLRVCTGGSDRATTTRSISDAEQELERASKVMLGTIAPSLRDAIDVETVSKTMFGKLCAEDTVLKLKNPEGITVRALPFLTRSLTRSLTLTLTITITPTPTLTLILTLTHLPQPKAEAEPEPNS